MPEMVLPGVYIQVRPEGLIVPGQVTVGNIGIIGTASRGPIGVPVLLGSYADATQKFGRYDAWPSDDLTKQKTALTLVRALELAYNQGATTVFAVRVANTATTGSSAATAAAPAQTQLQSASGNNVNLVAQSEGTWGNGLSYNVWDADQPAIVEGESHKGGAAITLLRKPIVRNASNRIQVNNRVLNIGYDDGTGHPDQLLPGGVLINLTNGLLEFPPHEEPASGDTLTANYAVDQKQAVKVTLRLGRAEEVYTVVDGNDLAHDINDPLSGSAWVNATPSDHPTEPPTRSKAADIFTPFSGGKDGADASSEDYKNGLDALLDQNVHIIIAAGQDQTFGNTLDAHCQKASTDAIKRDRIAVVGSGLIPKEQTIEPITSHNLDSDRLVFVVPGIMQIDAAASPAVEVTLPGAYTAAAIAGLLSSFQAHISLTNKVLPVDGLERQYNAVELTQLVLARVVALESRQGFHIVKGITTSTNTAFQQITTRRIVDFAKFGVRSAADPYIGLLNNERVRGALRSTINSFLADMVNNEMLISYDLDVTATRDQEIRGIVQVTMTLRPVFSIDFIQVTMFLG